MELDGFEVKIADLGFARHAADIMESYCGTPLNMAPEILEKR